MNDAIKKQMEEYEKKLFNGGVHCHEKYLKYRAERTCKGVMVLASRRKYNNLRESLGLPEVTDWKEKP